MSMTTGDQFDKSELFLKVTAALFRLAEEAMRQEMTMKEFERGLLGGLLCTGKRFLDQLLIAQRTGHFGNR